MWPPNGYGYKMMEAIWRVDLALPSFVSFDSVIIDSARNSPPKLGDRETAGQSQKREGTKSCRPIDGLDCWSQRFQDQANSMLVDRQGCSSQEECTMAFMMFHVGKTEDCRGEIEF